MVEIDLFYRIEFGGDFGCVSLGCSRFLVNIGFGVIRELFLNRWGVVFGGGSVVLGDRSWLRFIKYKNLLLFGIGL